MAADANSEAIAGTQTDSVGTDFDAELIDLVGCERLAPLQLTS